MASQKPTLFISYRRADHPDFVERIRDWFIANGYDDERVFMDLSNMPYFTDFAEFIREKILESEVVIVIIGPQWMEHLRERATRDEPDYVRLEIAIALEQGKLVAPICIKGAKMPAAKDLQDFPDLKQITRYHAPELDSGRPFLKNIADIIGALEAELDRRRSKIKPIISPEQQKLLSLITDTNTIPPVRSKAGQRLADIGDPRPGVGLKLDGTPDIEWVRIPEGQYIIGGDDLARNSLPHQQVELTSFFIGRYPVTYIQFQSFIGAFDGYQNEVWWQGLAKHEKQPYAQQWPIANHPRENVSWYQAVAFCRWLSMKLGFEVRLPTEQEWEQAARTTVGYFFPWGDEYVSGYANIDETYENKDRRVEKVGVYCLHQTSPVGIYTRTISPDILMDMSGNVWEWCLNKFDFYEDIRVSGTWSRAIRGGSWCNAHVYARAAARDWRYPDYWDSSQGFRLACSQPF